MTLKNNSQIDILIADDHSLIVQGIKDLINKEIPSAEVDTVTSKESLFNQVEVKKPDVILLDLFIGQNKAHDFFDDLKKATESSKIIIISSNEDMTTVSHFMNRGADGFIGKSEDTTLIIKAILEVLEGNEFLSETLKTRLTSNESINDNLQNIRLTRREKEVLAELLKEKSNKEIAESLFISEKTVEHHKSNLYVKFDVKNASGLVKKALINGFYE